MTRTFDFYHRNRGPFSMSSCMSPDAKDPRTKEKGLQKEPDG